MENIVPHTHAFKFNNDTNFIIFCVPRLLRPAVIFLIYAERQKQTIDIVNREIVQHVTVIDRTISSRTHVIGNYDDVNSH